MARLDANLTVSTGEGKEYLCSMSDQYTEVYQEVAKVDNTDTFITLATLSKTNASLLKGSKLIIIKNNSPISIELQLHINAFQNSTNIDQYLSDLFITPLLGGNEYMVIPNQWISAYNADVSGGNAKTIDNKGGYDVNSGNLYVAASDILLDEGSNINTSVTNFTVDDGDYFRAGDLIRLDDEIMEVTSIDTNELYVIRATHGSTAASHNDDVAIRLPFFNAYSNYNKFTYSQTNESGKFKSTNLFGYGRSKTYPTGIAKGSFAAKFYNAGYQEWNISGITPSTHSGLAASTAYAFNITVDGGSTFASLSFTTDASNLNFGGNNGVISKIQSALDTQYYTAGNLFEKKVTVAIVNGDIRFTSGNRTRASAIALAAPTSGTTPFGVGRIPAIGSIESAVAAVLPDDSIFDAADYIESKNKNIFAYDDGKGNIQGAASGTINYETGAIDISGPANAEFVASFNYDSAHSGGINSTSNQENCIIDISARSMNSKIDAEVEIIGFV